MRKLQMGALAVGILSCAASARAQALIVEGVYDRPASNIAFCAPCMTVWFVGAAPGAPVEFSFEQPFPSATPVVQSVQANELGIAVYDFRPTADGEVRIQASSGPRRASPKGCIPPIGPPRQCPPPPQKPLRVSERDPIAIELGDALAGTTRLTLHQLRTGADPRWEAVPGRAVLAAKPVRQARIAARPPLRAGLYRLQFLDKDKRVLAVSLIEVAPRKP